MRFFLMAATTRIFNLTTAMIIAQEAQAGQGAVGTINVVAVCTAGGSAMDDPRWAAYPVKIVLVIADGANLANAHVTLNKDGKEVASLDCDAPWILFKAPPGFYTATTTLTARRKLPSPSCTTTLPAGQ